MAARMVGAALGLFAFAVSVAAGLYVGNPVTVVLSRGILSLFCFFLIGLVVGVAAHHVLVEHVKARESDIRKQFSRATDAPDAVTATRGAAKE